MIVIVGLSRGHRVDDRRLRFSGEMVRRKKIDVQSKLLRRVERAAGERVVEWAAFDAEDQGYRGVGGLSGCADNAAASTQAAANT